MNGGCCYSGRDDAEPVGHATSSGQRINYWTSGMILPQALYPGLAEMRLSATCLFRCSLTMCRMSAVRRGVMRRSVCGVDDHVRIGTAGSVACDGRLDGVDQILIAERLGEELHGTTSSLARSSECRHGR